ncbi:MAG TPA: TonB-dependent receptor [Vicinamibacterales bacterium]
MKGRVVDPDGRAVPLARVLVTGDGSTSSALTNERGEFEIATPDAGRLGVRIAAEGFRAEPRSIDATRDVQDLGTIALAVSAVSESLVVSASQVEIPLSQASSSVTVITAKELAERQIHTVADALRTVPGIGVVATGGAGAVTSVFPRGGESDYTMVVIDGVQANAFGGLYDFAHLSTENVERIEVVRGPQSALFGSNAIGSVVRIITRRDGPPSASASFEGGSFGTTRATGATSGSRGAWSWGGGAERLSSDGQNGRITDAGQTVANDEYDRYSLTGSGGWRDAAGRNVRATVRYSSDDRGFPGPFGTNPIGVFGGIDTVSRGTDDRWLTSGAAVLPFGRRVRVQAQVSYGRIDGTYQSPSFIGPAEPPTESESYSRRWNARVQSDIVLSPSLDLSAGAEFERERAGSTYITGEAFQMVPVKRHVAAVFAEARWRWNDRLFVTGGLRVDDISRDALEGDPNAFLPRPAFAADSVVSANPKIAVAWFARSSSGNFTKVRASAGTGIRPPDGFEIAYTDNPSLAPERSISIDAGLDQAFAGGHGLVEATAFYNNYDDLIVAVGSFVEASRYRTDNIANARARGLELAGTARARIATARPIDLEWRVAYTFLDTEVLAVDQANDAPPPFTVGDPLLRRPRHQASTYVTATTGRLTAYLQGGGRGRALDVEPSYGTYGGLFYAAGYQSWNAGASWRVRRSAEIFARIDNLFDRAYEEALGFPAPGRGAFVGVRIAAGR